MLLRQLQYFCAVAARGSFTQAAEDCFVSQSAISQQIKALEADLGCELLARHGRSFSLTPAGEHLYRRAQTILDDIETLRYETQDIASGAPRRLRIGYLNRYDGWEVSGAVAAFARRHPHVEVVAEGDSHDGLYQKMLSGQLDLLFNDRRRRLSSDFENRYLFSGYHYIEVSEGSSLAAHERLAVSQLSGITCILVAPPEQEETERTYYRDTLGFTCDFTRADTMEQARFMVAGNRGFLPVEARVGASAASGTVIRRIPLMGPAAGEGKGNNGLVQLRSEYYAFWLKVREHPYASEFADILAELFA